MESTNYTEGNKLDTVVIIFYTQYLIQIKRV